VLRPVRALVFAALIACGVAACGADNTIAVTLPTTSFVGNSTCPTAGATPYFSGTPTPVNGSSTVGEAIDEMPHTHVAMGTKITYNHDPPTSGCHYSLGYGVAPIQTGAYDKTIAPEYWVHNLEHGYVAILYNCLNGCDPQFQQLRSWYKTLSPDLNTGYAKVIILPWPTLSVPFAAVSWDWYLPIPNFSITEVQRFYTNHVDRSPEGGGP
jgi:hypothetical protein